MDTQILLRHSVTITIQDQIRTIRILHKRPIPPRSASNINARTSHETLRSRRLPHVEDLGNGRVVDDYCALAGDALRVDGPEELDAEENFASGAGGT